MTLFMELTVPKVVDTGLLLDTVLEQMNDELGIIERQFDKTYSTWSAKSKPAWTITRGSLMGRDVDYGITTRDVPYVWVNNGTPHGRVGFSSDYRPMTSPRKISSKQRKGRVLVRGRSAPFITGIKPRFFDDEIAKRRRSPFAKKVQKRIAINIKKIIRGKSTTRVSL